MTWTRVTQSPVGVTAWLTGLPGTESKVQIGVGTATAQLSLEDAASLGGYLLSHAPKEDDQ